MPTGTYSVKRAASYKGTVSQISERKAVVPFLVDLLRDERLKQGLSQYELAARAGLRHTAILRLERAQRRPSLDTLLAIADGLGCDLGVMISHAVGSVRGRGKDRK